MCVHITSLSIHLLMDTEVASVTFPIVNNAMNIALCVFFQMVFLFSMNMYLGAELLDHVVVLFLVF